MKKVIQKIDRMNPILIILVLWILPFFIRRIHILHHVIDYKWIQSICNGIMGLICLGVMYRVIGKDIMCWTKKSGRYTLFRSICLFIMAVLFSSFEIRLGAQVLKSNWMTLAWCNLILYLSVGLYEEAFFRGIVLNGLVKVFPKSKAGLYIAVATSSFLFGLVHIDHLILLDIEVLPKIGVIFLQFFYPCMSGLFFATSYLKTKNIWICMIVHGIYDWLCSLSQYWVSFYSYKNKSVEEEMTEIVIHVVSMLIVGITQLVISLKILKNLDTQDCVMWKDEIHNPIEETVDNFDETESCRG